MSSSSNVAIVMAILILLLLQMHACMAARQYPSHHFQSVNKLQDADNTKLVHETNINEMFEEAKEMTSEDVTIGTLDKNVAPVTTDMQHNIEAKPRTMVESNETKEATGANEVEPVEDTTVEDYVQIHRKSPIHNHH